jgi:ABC-type polysaccharide/polyol phosphate export permease
LFSNLASLFRYRGLIQSLVARDLKARYRGSVLGFFWSFFNPLLLLLVYSFVFTVVMPGLHPPDLEPFALFRFCGILPWTWFSSSLIESSGSLISGGNLIKKVCFRPRCCPSSLQRHCLFLRSPFSSSFCCITDTHLTCPI